MCQSGLITRSKAVVGGVVMGHPICWLHVKYDLEHIKSLTKTRLKKWNENIIISKKQVYNKI